MYADFISDAVLAEELGFTSSWYGEHHFRECQWTGSPMLVATAVAARTEHLRIGTAVTLLPFHDPIRVAEDAAITDILSGGRFDLGVGPGSQYEEFVTFGRDPAEMNQRVVGDRSTSSSGRSRSPASSATRAASTTSPT